MILNVIGITMAERQGFEPWRRLPVDRLAICSITTLAPLPKQSAQKYTLDKKNAIFFEFI